MPRGPQGSVQPWRYGTEKGRPLGGEREEPAIDEAEEVAQWNSMQGSVAHHKVIKAVMARSKAGMEGKQRVVASQHHHNSVV